MGRYSLSDSGIKTAIAFVWLVTAVLVGAQGAILIQSALFDCGSENLGVLSSRTGTEGWDVEAPISPADLTENFDRPTFDGLAWTVPLFDDQLEAADSEA